MLQACLNGSRNRNDHPAIPFTSEEIAIDAEKVVRAGAAELHIHVRDEQGSESLEAIDVARTLLAVRERVSGIPIGISTVRSIVPDSGARMQLMRSWKVLPDYVSINIREPDAEWIIATALSLGIDVEAGLCSEADAERFAAMPGCEACLRILVGIHEPDSGRESAAVRQIQRVLKRVGCTLPILLHGSERTMWSMYIEAMLQGFGGRIGLEDGSMLLSGITAKDNEELVQTAKLIEGRF
ncbi:3-keto-5-aminohexanoate cleavage protein [Saccharibacillus kuerlensis]|uniref:3-keto-5-aminohexanoate cleavage enzyme n=1 Tax=Saccharibacillus kuerlensis TaxID=459527 RepID=A0ABQ2KRG7_9BACL|nr:3-keto-5-aminohexanoate cleavage protein [Saccharibacillus kuerlensis]GGN91105.1 3-keto-5-aminohexanoate cleavage enzyme [Saccharibacillus kuerlensis]